MDVSRPASVVAPTLDIDVLMVLAGTTRPLTGREVSRLAGRGSQSGIWKALGRLAEQGLVDVLEASPALVYTLNREHVAAPAVLVLADLRAELLRRIRTHAEGWSTAPVSMAVFGSTARGDGDLQSDIDLFIVRSDQVDSDDVTWREQVSGLSKSILGWTGNRASMIEVSLGEARAMYARQAPVVGELVRDAVPLVGHSISDVLEGRVG